jgi:large subunit ribosomal protein L13
MKTFLMKKQDVQRKWWVVDADGLVLGRMAVPIALALMGKDKPTYTPNVDCGDYVIVVNADKVRVTGSKADERQYDYYTRYPGGRKYSSFAEMFAKKPEKVIELAVRRMLPKNKLARKMILRLKVVRGPEHNHQAQNPQKLTI